MTPAQIAIVAKKLNRAYHVHLGAEGEPPGSTLPDWMMAALNDALKDEPPPAALHTIPVKYIGRRETYKDGLYETGLVFTKGETKMVPLVKAMKMLKHPDVYERGEAPAGLGAVAPTPEPAKEKVVDDSDSPLQIARDSLAHMPKDGLLAFIKTNFNQDVSKHISEENARNKAMQLVDQYGIS